MYALPMVLVSFEFAVQCDTFAPVTCGDWHIPYSSYFLGGKFCGFRSWEAYHEIFTHETVPHSTGVWFSILRPWKFLHELPKSSLLTKILPLKNTHYTVTWKHLGVC